MEEKRGNPEILYYTYDTRILNLGDVEEMRMNNYLDIGYLIRVGQSNRSAVEKRKVLYSNP